MTRSTDRILTTHVGSLRRGPDARTPYKKENGQPYEQAELGALVEGADRASARLWRAPRASR
jgi:hypothetical protein